MSQVTGSSSSLMMGMLSALMVGLSDSVEAGAGIACSCTFILSSLPATTAHLRLIPTESFSSRFSQVSKKAALASSPLWVKMTISFFSTPFTMSYQADVT